MLKRPFALLTPLLALFVPLVAVSQSEPQQTAEQATVTEIRQMNWQSGPARKTIRSINAHYDLGENDALLTGSEARRALKLSEGAEFPDVDVLVVQGLGEGQAPSQTLLAHHDVGYVTDDDWNSLEPEHLLKGIREATNQQNEQRENNGFATLIAEGWRVEPHYDRQSRTAFWAIDVRSSDDVDIVNAVALKLSRDGFTRATWAGGPEQFRGEETLVQIGEDFQFKDGYRYADYRDGDVMAGVGLAALATGIATGKGWQKAAATGLIATLIAFAKKAWWLVLLPFAWLGRKFFARGKNPA